MKNIPIYLHGSVKNITTSSEEKLVSYKYNTFDKGVIIGELPPTLCYKSAYSSYDKNDEERPDPYINNCGLYSRQSIFESALFDCSKHNQAASSGGTLAGPAPYDALRYAPPRAGDHGYPEESPVYGGGARGEKPEGLLSARADARYPGRVGRNGGDRRSGGVPAEDP